MSPHSRDTYAKNSKEKPLNLEISSILEAGECKLSDFLTFDIPFYTSQKTALMSRKLIFFL